MAKVLRLVVLACTFATAARAEDPPLGPELPINTYTTGAQSRPAVAADAIGNFVVVWTSEGQDGSGNGVFGQRYDSEGTALGAEFPVNTYTTNDQESPSAAMDPSGRFVVVWQSQLQDGSDWGVFAQRFDADGSPLGVETRINASIAGNQTSPDVDVDDAGNFIVVWQSDSSSPAVSKINGRMYDSGGDPLGGEFRINQPFGDSVSPAVARAGGGQFVVAWTSQSYYGNFAMVRRYDASGAPACGEMAVGPNGSGPDVEISASGRYVVTYAMSPHIMARRFILCNAQSPAFVVDTSATSQGAPPAIANDASGNFLVTWESPLEGSGSGIYGQRFAEFGSRIGDEFLVNSFTAGDQADPAVAVASGGNAVLAWQSLGQDGSDLGVYARQAEAVTGSPTPSPTPTATPPTGTPTPTPTPPSTAASALDVDLHPASAAGSNLNGLLEAGETVRLEPTWHNLLPAELELTGVASDATGPPGPVYQIVDGTASYGSIAAGESSNCAEATSDCLEFSLGGARPAAHWDASFRETLSTGEARRWALHVAGSFADVPAAHPFYAGVETLFHHGVTAGCGTGSYCPGEAVRRDQMAVFLLKSVRGGLYVPPSCNGIFVDVPCPSPFAKWVEKLFVDGITAGCGEASYCPSAAVTRAQMAVFLLKAEHGSDYSPPSCNGLFDDVPCPGPFADWIEQLFDEAITAGCGGENYCPDEPANRGQMAVFLTRTFGLKLYGP